jgi:hypothetical protein
MVIGTPLAATGRMTSCGGATGIGLGGTTWEGGGSIVTIRGAGAGFWGAATTCGGVMTVIEESGATAGTGAGCRFRPIIRSQIDGAAGAFWTTVAWAWTTGADSQSVQPACINPEYGEVVALGAWLTATTGTGLAAGVRDVWTGGGQVTHGAEDGLHVIAGMGSGGGTGLRPGNGEGLTTGGHVEQTGVAGFGAVTTVLAGGGGGGVNGVGEGDFAVTGGLAGTVADRVDAAGGSCFAGALDAIACGGAAGGVGFGGVSGVVAATGNTAGVGGGDPGGTGAPFGGTPLAPQ